MNDLLDLLDHLNRKERFFLVAQALGNRTFTPDADFLAAVGPAASVEFPAVNQVHCFMDFHLDWIYAALVLARDGREDTFPSPQWLGSNPDGPVLNVNDNQEDVDLLLAFEEGHTTHLVMIEAKADTNWTLSQVLSKARRLHRIFGEHGHEFDGVEPHFVIMSPERSAALDAKVAGHGDVPPWMRPNGALPWAKLEMPGDRLRLTRCNQSREADKTGDHWRLE